MATEFYLKIISKVSGELKGGSTSKLCKDQIQVNDFLVSVYQPMGNAYGGNQPSTQFVLEDVEFEIPVGTSTVALLDAISKHEVLKEVTLSCLKVGNNPHIYLQWRFMAARVASFKMVMGANDEPIVKLKLAYAVIELAYKHQKQDGSFEGTRSTAFSAGENKAVDVTLEL